MTIARLSLQRRTLLAAGGAALLSRAARAASDPSVLRIGNQKGGIRSLLEASGVAQDLPYRIEWSEFPAAAPLLEALNAGALDLGYQGDLAFLTSFASGAPVRAIGAVQGSATAQAILVADRSPYRTLADLRGHKIAGNRAGWGQYLVRSALKQAQIAPGEIGLTLLPPADAALAFRSGAVEGWAIWEPYVSLEVMQFGARVLLDGAGLTPAVVLVSAHEQAIQTKRAALADFLTRFQAAWLWAESHYPDYATYNAKFTGLPQPVLQRAYESEHVRPVQVTPALIAMLQQAANNSVEFGLLRETLDVKRAFDTSFSAV